MWGKGTNVHLSLMTIEIFSGILQPANIVFPFVAFFLRKKMKNRIRS